MDETYIRVVGQWKYLYRAVDRNGLTVDFLLRDSRDHAAARAFFERGIDRRDIPAAITIDKSGANTAAIASLTSDVGLCIKLRQSKDLNNLVEQDHRAVNRITRPTPRFKNFWSSRAITAGIEVMHMIRKGQLGGLEDRASSVAQQFYTLAV